MTTQLRVKIKDSIFPIRIKGDRYQNGDELIVDKKDFTEKMMEIVEEIKQDPEFDALKEKAKELKIKGYTKMEKEELHAAIEEKLAEESE
ncbi:Rho termination factor N-terminal domain-containing protein [Cytobacillus sp.]|uniref:Rho termination factor N-terminal domain-containing protein n=1 Tax=Cytobacillus sp. TaxID=2675269 RepID=UPI0028BD7F36|nr:Rho termination factor N-terminal domain-containing protein [Cytobacillus sp.]